MNVVALVVDLADRSALGDGVRFVRRADDLADAVVDAGADVVVVDLTVPGSLEAVAAVVRGGGRVVAYAPHVAADLLEAAAAQGAEAMPRSRFFREVERGVFRG